MRVKKYIILQEKLAKAIFKELGNVEGLSRFPSLQKLEEIIVKTLELDKEV